MKGGRRLSHIRGVYKSRPSSRSFLPFTYHIISICTPIFLPIPTTMTFSSQSTTGPADASGLRQSASASARTAQDRLMETMQQRRLDLESGASGLPSVILGAKHLRAMRDYGNHPFTDEATKQSFDQVYRDGYDGNLAQLKMIDQRISTCDESINRYHGEQNSFPYSDVSSGPGRSLTVLRPLNITVLTGRER
jgi:hypothetical protein